MVTVKAPSKKRYKNPRTGQIYSESNVKQEDLVNKRVEEVRPQSPPRTTQQMKADRTRQAVEAEQRAAELETLKERSRGTGETKKGEILTPQMAEKQRQDLQTSKEILKQVPTEFEEKEVTAQEEEPSKLPGFIQKIADSPPVKGFLQPEESQIKQGTTQLGAGVALGTGVALAPFTLGASLVPGSLIAGSILANAALQNLNFNQKQEASLQGTIYDGAIGGLSKTIKGLNLGEDPDVALQHWNENLDLMREAEYSLKELQANDLGKFINSGADKELARIEQFRRDYDVYWYKRLQAALLKPNRNEGLKEEAANV